MSRTAEKVDTVADQLAHKKESGKGVAEMERRADADRDRLTEWLEAVEKVCPSLLGEGTWRDSEMSLTGIPKLKCSCSLINFFRGFPNCPQPRAHPLNLTRNWRRREE